MSGHERRMSPRKVCAIPLQFRLVSNGNSSANQDAAGATGTATAVRTAEGQALNVSERGMYFTSREKLSVGQAIEMFFVLPGELTGRGAEPVKCNAHVRHVDYASNIQGVGVSVDRFEAAIGVRDWSN